MSALGNLCDQIGVAKKTHRGKSLYVFFEGFWHLNGARFVMKYGMLLVFTDRYDVFTMRTPIEKNLFFDHIFSIVCLVKMFVSLNTPQRKSI